MHLLNTVMKMQMLAELEAPAHELLDGQSFWSLSARCSGVQFVPRLSETVVLLTNQLFALHQYWYRL